MHDEQYSYDILNLLHMRKSKTLFPSESFINAIKWIMLLFMIFTFFFKTVYFIDPDLGWHLRAGERVVLDGWAPPTNDPWTYTMPSHEWVNHEWFLDGVLWSLFANGLWVIPIIIASLIPIAIVTTWIFRSRTIIELALIMIPAELLLMISGVRPQLLSVGLFFLLHELLNIDRQNLRNRLLLLTPLYFFLWSHLHAGFPAGFILWGAHIAVMMYEKRNTLDNQFLRKTLGEILLLGASILATFLTPYHYRLWIEIARTSTSSFLENISEWQFAFFHTDMVFSVFLGVVIALVLLFRNEVRKSHLVPALVFFTLFMKHIRMAPFFSITVFPLITWGVKCCYSFIQERRKDVGNIIISRIEQVSLLCIVLYLGAFFIVNPNILNIHTPPFSGVYALGMLKESGKISGNVFNDYGFGGLLIYADPDAKYFIDGRLPHWSYSDGRSAMRSYLYLVNSPKDLREEFERYDIRTAILPVHSGMLSSELEESLVGWRAPFAPLVRFLAGKPKLALSAELLNLGWCKVYEDDDAIILVDPNNRLCDERN
jgi:hypothetical protein